MSKYTWADMELCKVCHYKNEDPDLCNYYDTPEEKSGPKNFYNMDCARFLRESKFQRMPEEHYQQLREEYEKYIRPNRKEGHDMKK